MYRNRLVIYKATLYLENITLYTMSIFDFKIKILLVSYGKDIYAGNTIVTGRYVYITGQWVG